MLDNKYFAVLIGVILAGVIAYNVEFFSSRNNNLSEAGIPKTEMPPESYDAAQNRPPERIITKKDTNDWKRDPFSLEKVSEKAEYNLIGIIKRDGKSLALINGGIFSEGETIGNTLIKEIRRESILLAVNGLNKEIFIEDNNILKENKE